MAKAFAIWTNGFTLYIISSTGKDISLRPSGAELKIE